MSNADGGKPLPNIIERRDKQLLGSLVNKLSAVRVPNFVAIGIAHGCHISRDFGPEALWEVRGDVVDLPRPSPDHF